MNNSKGDQNKDKGKAGSPPLVAPNPPAAPRPQSDSEAKKERRKEIRETLRFLFEASVAIAAFVVAGITWRQASLTQESNDLTRESNKMTRDALIAQLRATLIFDGMTLLDFHKKTPIQVSIKNAGHSIAFTETINLEIFAGPNKCTSMPNVKEPDRTATHIGPEQTVQMGVEFPKFPREVWQEINARKASIYAFVAICYHDAFGVHEMSHCVVWLPDQKIWTDCPFGITSN
jgi:hypothetical protein